MKYILLIIIVLETISVDAQTQTQKLNLINELISVTQVKQGTVKLIDQLINSYLSKTPNAPKSIVAQIHDNIDYEDYLIKVRLAYSQSYSEAEVKELISAYMTGNTALYTIKSEKVSPILYDIGTAFGKAAVKVILQKLEPYK